MRCIDRPGLVARFFRSHRTHAFSLVDRFMTPYELNARMAEEQVSGEPARLANHAGVLCVHIYTRLRGR